MASTVDSIEEWAGLEICVFSVWYLGEQQGQGNTHHVGCTGIGVVPALALGLQDFHLVCQLLYYYAARWNHHLTLGTLPVLLDLWSQHMDVPSLVWQRRLYLELQALLQCPKMVRKHHLQHLNSGYHLLYLLLLRLPHLQWSSHYIRYF